MGKGALLYVIFGALFALSFACETVPYHFCVKADAPKKCSAVEVCADPKKELCGKSYCQYPYTCASIKKNVCKDFLKLKQKCEIKKACKEVRKPCGKGSCKITHDCVKEKICYIKKVYGGGRKLMDGSSATATSVAVAKDNSAADATSTAKAFDGSDADAASLAVAENNSEASADSLAIADGGSLASSLSEAFAFGEEEEEEKPAEIVVVKPYKEILVCEDKFTCVAKEPCKDVVVKRCVKDYLRPGIDLCHGGHPFVWYNYAYANERCGEDYCGVGYKCADVVVQKCETPCGNGVCKYGEECVTSDKECEDFPYLETVCKDVLEPTCVPLTPYLKSHYKPPCKTVWKCEEKESVCGNKYCDKGYKCVVDYKKVCGVAVLPKEKREEKPEPPKKKPVKVVPVVDVPPKKEEELALATSTSHADGDSASTDTKALAKGEESKALATGQAEGDGVGAASLSLADTLTGTAVGKTAAFADDEDKEANAGAEAALIKTSTKG